MTQVDLIFKMLLALPAQALSYSGRGGEKGRTVSGKKKPDEKPPRRQQAIRPKKSQQVL
jgi:hypothetical protein